MAVYAVAGDLTVYLASRPDLAAPADVEVLLREAEQDVDIAIGAFPKLASGLALDPATLTAVQVDALRRATVFAAEFRLETGDELVGATEYVAGPLSVAWRGSRPPGPKVLEALAGHGLYRRSGCAAPSPLPPLPLYWP